MGRGFCSVLLVGWALWGCEVEGDAEEGDACVRTSQCQMLLACIEGVCTRALDSVAEQSTVPDLVRDAAAPDVDEMMADAMVADAAAPPPPADDADADGGS